MRVIAIVLMLTAATLAAHERAEAAERGVTADRPAPAGSFGKVPDLPDGYFTAKSTLARTKVRHEWVDIPLDATKLRTWIGYPDGTAKAPVVILMPYDAGLDDWSRALANQLAQQGFIAIAPDILSGLGPKRGNRDTMLSDQAMRVKAGMQAGEVLRRFKAAREYAMKLPRANGRSAALGIATGATDAYRFAADVPDLQALVVFYGAAPDHATLTKIKAPVVGFYGEKDFTVTPTVEKTAAAITASGHSFESHIYPLATQEFLKFVTVAENSAATAAAWPKAIAFLQEHLQ